MPNSAAPRRNSLVSRTCTPVRLPWSWKSKQTPNRYAEKTNYENLGKKRIKR